MPDPPATPRITKVLRLRATLSHGNGILVEWVGTGNSAQVVWNGNPQKTISWPSDAPLGTSESNPIKFFAVPTQPGTTQNLQVQNCFSDLTGTACSNWAKATPTAVQNTTSLRNFINGSLTKNDPEYGHNAGVWVDPISSSDENNPTSVAYIRNGIRPLISFMFGVEYAPGYYGNYPLPVPSTPSGAWSLRGIMQI